MKTSNLSIEDRHSIAFGAFISELSKKFQPLQIFCFYKRSFQEKRLSCFVNELASSNHEYGILLVTATATRIDYEVQDYANSHFTEGMMTVICHGNQSIWEAIDANSRFFRAIFISGELLYSHDGLLVRPYISRHNPVNGGRKALKHYNHRMPLAEGFMMCAFECLEKEQFGMCAFMLHQAVEQACICMIRVHIAYRSEFHNLHRLLRLCLCFSERPFQLFLSTTEDERLFGVMAKSYSCSRYKDDFSVSGLDAKSLYQRVASFILLAKEMCNEKIELLDQDAVLYSVLKNTETVQIETTG